MSTAKQPPARHWHVWRIAAGGKAAFCSRGYLVRGSASAAAERWTGTRGGKRDDRRGWAFVRECGLGGFCPRPPRREGGSAMSWTVVRGETGHGSDVVIVPEEIDDALNRCVLCGGRLGDDDDTVHSRVSDCRPAGGEEEG